jgi:ribosome maturation factor RimP
VDVTTKVAEIIEPSLIGLGYQLVRVSFQSGTLQIMAERGETGVLSIDDCTEISRTVSALLDVADPIRSRYMLEVSSPGVDRPLVRLSDFERFAGQTARLELSVAQDGQKRFKGIVRGANGSKVRFETEGTVHEFEHADIANAHLDIADIVFAKGEKKKFTGKAKQTAAPKSKKVAKR